MSTHINDILKAEKSRALQIILDVLLFWKKSVKKTQPSSELTQHQFHQEKMKKKKITKKHHKTKLVLVQSALLWEIKFSYKK